MPQAGLWIQHRDLRGNLLDTWQQPISSEAKNRTELLTVNIDKPLTAGTIEIYLQNGSKNGVYYWGHETQKEVTEIEQKKEFIESPIAEIKTSLLLGCPMGFSTNGRGGCVDKADQNLVVSYANAEQIRSIKQTVLLENVLNPNTKKVVKYFQVNTTKGGITIIDQTEANNRVCYTYPVCETLVWWVCSVDSFGNYFDCVFSHIENKCDGVTVCYELEDPIIKARIKACQDEANIIQDIAYNNCNSNALTDLVLYGWGGLVTAGATGAGVGAIAGATGGTFFIPGLGTVAAGTAGAIIGGIAGASLGATIGLYVTVSKYFQCTENADLQHNLSFSKCQ